MTEEEYKENLRRLNKLRNEDMAQGFAEQKLHRLKIRKLEFDIDCYERSYIYGGFT